MNLNLHSLRGPTRPDKPKTSGCPRFLCLLWAAPGCRAPRHFIFLIVMWTWFPLRVCMHIGSQVLPPVCAGSCLQQPGPQPFPKGTHLQGSKYWHLLKNRFGFLKYFSSCLANIFLLLLEVTWGGKSFP